MTIRQMRWAAAVVVLLLGAPATAAELSFGLGYDDVLGDGDGAASVAVQAGTDPVWRLGPVGLGLGAAAEADSQGDVWAGGGLTARLPLGERWRIDGSLMAGLYAFGGGEELGSDLEFRTRLGVSREVRPPWRLGIAVEHKSNGGLGEINPGVETIFLYLGRRF